MNNTSNKRMFPPVSDIMQVIKTFETEAESFKQTISEQRVEISGLYRRIDRKDRDILLLKKEIKELRARLSHYEKPAKDSHNSSIAPSKESISARAVRRTVSLREKSGRPTGGQTGHEGVTLQPVSTPTETHHHFSDFCRCCGASLADAPLQPLGTRQVVDLPDIKPVVREHHIYGKQCKCGRFNRGEFPKEARSPVCYGPAVRALISYFNVVQCIPYERICEVFKDCFALSLSQGTVDNILESMRNSSGQMYEEIRMRIEKSPVVGADETGMDVNGQLNWGWVFQTDKLTYLYHDASRGGAAIDKHFTNGLPATTLVTDRWSPYFSLPVKNHQICLAHLLRDLTYLSELDKTQNWSSSMLELFRETIHKRKTMNWTDIPRKNLFERLDKLLLCPLDKLHEDFGCLQRSLLKHRNHVFRFLSDPRIPYDNNASERAIRIVKVKQKVSGNFRAAKGADRFTQLLSITDTSHKNGMSGFKALELIAQRE